MKPTRMLFTAFIFLTVSCQALQNATTGLNVHINGIQNVSPLPSGTYYIVNGQHLALTPLEAGPGQNVFLRAFNRSGMQKWTVTRSGSTGTPSYTLRFEGETDGLWLQGFPVKDHTPIIGPASRPFSFKITAVPGTTDSWYIKSDHYGGDAMHSFVFSTELPTEIRFDPVENSPKFTWKFVPMVN